MMFSNGGRQDDVVPRFQDIHGHAMPSCAPLLAACDASRELLHGSISLSTALRAGMPWSSARKAGRRSRRR
jgi:hypothetical protein